MKIKMKITKIVVFTILILSQNMHGSFFGKTISTIKTCFKKNKKTIIGGAIAATAFGILGYSNYSRYLKIKTLTNENDKRFETINTIMITSNKITEDSDRLHKIIEDSNYRIDNLKKIITTQEPTTKKQEKMIMNQETIIKGQKKMITVQIKLIKKQETIIKEQETIIKKQKTLEISHYNAGCVAIFKVFEQFFFNTTLISSLQKEQKQVFIKAANLAIKECKAQIFTTGAYSDIHIIGDKLFNKEGIYEKVIEA